VRIKLDRTICDGFGVCAKHAPGYFSLDDWGYASLVGNGDIPEQDHDAVMRALFDCPVHAIISMSEHVPNTPKSPSTEEAPEPHPATEGSEAEGFVR
jgi:ferredoxin